MNRGLDIDFQLYAVEYLLVNAAWERALPTDKEFLLDEIINGAIAYSGGTARKARNAHSMLTSFTDDLWEEFQKEAKREKFQPNVYGCLEELARPFMVQGVHNDHGTGTQFYQLMCSGILDHVTFEDTMRISESQAKHFQKQGDKFVPAERKDLDGIAKCMQPFVKEDILYVRERYSR